MIYLLFGTGNGSNGSNELDHEHSGASCLDYKEISGTVLGLGTIFCWVLVFVIFTFFKEGIGSNLTMPYWGLGVLELGSLDQDLGTGNLESPF